VLVQEGRSSTAPRWPLVVAGIVLLWFVAVGWSLARPFTDHVPVAAEPPPRTTTPFVYRCGPPLGGAEVELRSGPASGEATPSRSGCAGPRSARRALAGIDLALTVVTVGALVTLVVRRRRASLA
jgi:hypothetical protein